jgi:hypothetical protein
MQRGAGEGLLPGPLLPEEVLPSLGLRAGGGGF